VLSPVPRLDILKFFRIRTEFQIIVRLLLNLIVRILRKLTINRFDFEGYFLDLRWQGSLLLVLVHHITGYIVSYFLFVGLRILN